MTSQLFAAAKFDPFEHVVDSDHITILESAGLVIHLSPFTKFQIFLLLSALVVTGMMFWLAAKMRSGELPKGRVWNFFETLLFFVRDKIAVPALGDESNKYVPFLTTLFLFIFVCNLFGLVPYMPSPTAHIYVTGALALIVFVIIHAAGIKEHGGKGYLKTFTPHVHLEGGVGMKIFEWVLKVFMTGLEYLTAFIRAFVLAMRLFANMLAGHTVLFVILFFIRFVDDPLYQIPAAAGQDWMYWPVTFFSVLLNVALSLLEIFIAGLQAFIFTFLSAIYIGLAKHPPH
ncbi:MAG TPA: F0F1 ATP synthase subunit A [Fimbriiglobus sp.]